MLVEGGQLQHALSQRTQLLDGLRAGGERRPPRLVVERHGHVGAHHPREGLDRVALERGQLVEAVEEDRVVAPPTGRRSQRVERGPGVHVGVGQSDPLELVGVAPVQRGEVSGVGAPARIA